MADVYSYESLPSGSIRYLLLQPGKSEEPIVCSLHVTKLEDPTPFEAISYVWGTSERTEPIECDGKTLYITVNLQNSLLAVRRVDESRALWSDSICINQADNEEKAQQVSLMAEIFRKSTRTLICLGSNDAGEHAEAAAGVVTEVNDMMDKVFQDKDFSWEPNSFPSPRADDPLISDPRWESIRILAIQPWFRRGWVVQEAASGPVAEIIWGSVQIDWLHLLRAYSWLLAKANVDYYKFQSLSMPWLHLRSFQTRLTRESRALQRVGYSQSLTFLEVLDFGRDLGVTDARDRIYACMSLPHSTTFQGPQLASLKPDYSRPPEQVYHDLACAYLEASGMDLDLLGYTRNFGHTMPAADCPSWVPLWHVDGFSRTLYGTTSRRHSSRTSGRMLSQPCLVDRSTLKVRGVLIGSLQHVTEESFGFDTTFETLCEIWREVQELGTSSHLGNNPYQASATRAFVRTLAAWNYSGEQDGRESREAAYMEYVQRWTIQSVGDAESKTIPSTRAEEDKGRIAAEMHKITMIISHNRKLFVSDRGYYGLAPFPAAKGDIICIIFGAKSPFLLREAGDASPGAARRYKLVSDVFMLSARGAVSSGELRPLGSAEGYDDWEDWDLQEQDILIC